MPEVKKQVYTRFVEGALNTAEQASFLDGLPDRSQFVQAGDEAETIHSTYFGVEPVSYTHLDVYKRQQQASYPASA